MVTSGSESIKSHGYIEDSNKLISPPNEKSSPWYLNTIIGFSILLSPTSPSQSPNTEVPINTPITISAANPETDQPTFFNFNKLPEHSDSTYTSDEISDSAELEIIDLNLFRQQLALLLKNIDPDKAPIINFQVYRDNKLTSIQDILELTQNEINFLENFHEQFTFYNKLLDALNEVINDAGITPQDLNLFVPDEILFILDPNQIIGKNNNITLKQDKNTQVYVSQINCSDPEVNCGSEELNHLFFQANKNDEVSNPLIDEILSNIVNRLFDKESIHNSFEYDPQFTSNAYLRHFVELIRNSNYRAVQDVALVACDVFMRNGNLQAIKNSEDVSSASDDLFKYLAKVILLLRILDNNHSLPSLQANSLINNLRSDAQVDWINTVANLLGLPNGGINQNSTVSDDITYFAATVKSNEFVDGNYGFAYIIDSNGNPITSDEISNIQVFYYNLENSQIKDIVNITEQTNYTVSSDGKFDIATPEYVTLKAQLADQVPVEIEKELVQISVIITTTNNKTVIIPFKFDRPN